MRIRNDSDRDINVIGLDVAGGATVDVPENISADPDKAAYLRRQFSEVADAQPAVSVADPLVMAAEDGEQPHEPDATSEAVAPPVEMHQGFRRGQRRSK